MKIVYCIESTFGSGGMERVLANKANYLADKVGYEIIIITTEQKDRPSFFKLSPNIKCYDLKINYLNNKGKGLFKKSIAFFFKTYQHKKRLSQLLFDIKPDIVISMFGNEANFICNIKDGSKKIVESHFSKYFRLQYNRTGLWKWFDLIRTRQDESNAKKFDSFVVLTNEDRELWGNFSNIKIIPNAAIPLLDEKAILDNKVIIAVGRLSYQKGYERLIQAWQTVYEVVPNWKLKIYGSGELYQFLISEIIRYNLSDSIEICPPTSQITKIYLNSSALVLSSRYEGLPMVLLEAMSYGLPVISYTCKCGPRDIINHKIDGLLVEEGNIPKLAEAMLKVIQNDDLRKKMGCKAKEKMVQYSEDVVMKKWLILFHSLTNH